MQTILTRIPPSGPDLSFEIPETPQDVGIVAYYVNAANVAGYATIQQALDAGEASGARAIELIVSRAIYTENPIIPDGVSVTISGQPGDIYAAELSGSFTWNPSGGSYRRFCLNNFYVSGGITGTATGLGGDLLLKCVGIDGDIVFTGAQVNVYVNGGEPWTSGWQGYICNCTTTGKVGYLQCGVYGDLTCTGAVGNPTLTNCALASGLTFTLAQSALFMQGCFPTGAAGGLAVVFSGAPGRVVADGWTMGRFMESTPTAITPTNGNVQQYNSLEIVTQSAVDNVAPFMLWENAPAGLYRVTASVQVYAIGTTGTLQANVIFTDVVGAATAVISGAAVGITAPGRGQGTYTFSNLTEGGDIQASLTGVVTPGGLAAACYFCVEFLGN
jgi:hypothetical protein